MNTENFNINQDQRVEEDSPSTRKALFTKQENINPCDKKRDIWFPENVLNRVSMVIY